MKNLTKANTVIHRSQIVEITDQNIVVRSATIPHATGLTAILNPFKKARPLASESAKLKIGS